MFVEAKGDPFFFERPIDVKKLRATFSGDVYRPKPDKSGTPCVAKVTAEQERIWRALVDVVRGGGSVKPLVSPKK